MVANRSTSNPYRSKKFLEGRRLGKERLKFFDLVAHPQAKRAYAWSYRDGDQNKTIAVLGIPPVDSPQSAVKASIAAQAKSKSE